MKLQCSYVICIEARCSLGLDASLCDALWKCMREDWDVLSSSRPCKGRSVQADQMELHYGLQLTSIFTHTCVFVYEGASAHSTLVSWLAAPPLTLNQQIL